MTVDVEGMDEQIVRSINYGSGGPKVISVETITFSAHRQGQKKTDVRDFLQKNGYLLFADTYINTIFVRKKDWLTDDAFKRAVDRRPFCVTE